MGHRNWSWRKISKEPQNWDPLGMHFTVQQQYVDVRLTRCPERLSFSSNRSSKGNDEQKLSAFTAQVCKGFRYPTSLKQASFLLPNSSTSTTGYFFWHSQETCSSKNPFTPRYVGVICSSHQGAVGDPGKRIIWSQDDSKKSMATPLVVSTHPVGSNWVIYLGFKTIRWNWIISSTDWVWHHDLDVLFFFFWNKSHICMVKMHKYYINSSIFKPSESDPRLSKTVWRWFWAPNCCFFLFSSNTASSAQHLQHLGPSYQLFWERASWPTIRLCFELPWVSCD